MPVKFTYETAWNGGTVQVQTGSLEELTKIVKDLQESSTPSETEVGNAASNEYPQIGGDVGCAAAIRTLLSSAWGRAEPRTEAELTDAMKANAIHYQRGTISGLLTNLTRKGQLRRTGKKNGSYGYAINNRNPESQDN
jgi:hypothetical protein